MTAFLSSLFSCNAQNTDSLMAPEHFQAAYQADTTAVLIDVRTEEEYAEGHLAQARNIDFLQSDAFDSHIALLPKEHTYYIYCRSGMRSKAAADKMKALGLKVVDMKGGFLAWKEAKMPIEE